MPQVTVVCSIILCIYLERVSRKLEPRYGTRVVLGGVPRIAVRGVSRADFIATTEPPGARRHHRCMMLWARRSMTQEPSFEEF